MKLHNKKTGEIGDIAQTSNKAIIVYYPIVDGVATNPQHRGIYESLAELNEEWEDYEEPKDFWFIDDEGDVEVEGEEYEEHLDEMKSIGNYFNTREEAEQAVEKLKAWKRLKDKGFRFTGIAGLKSEIHFCADEKYDDAHIMFDEYGSSSDDLKQYNKDLDLLFGGEE